MTALPLLSICIGYDALSRTSCRRQAEEEFIAGCVHEHVAPRPLCQYHLADLAEGRMVCGNCFRCSDPHRCVLQVIPTRAAQEVPL